MEYTVRPDSAYAKIVRFLKHITKYVALDLAATSLYKTIAGGIKRAWGIMVTLTKKGIQRVYLFFEKNRYTNKVNMGIYNGLTWCKNQWIRFRNWYQSNVPDKYNLVPSKQLKSTT